MSELSSNEVALAKELAATMLRIDVLAQALPEGTRQEFFIEVHKGVRYATMLQEVLR